MYGIVDRSIIEQITFQTDEERFVRWLAEANAAFNNHMIEQVNDGKTVREAYRSYRNASHIRLAQTIVEAHGQLVTGSVTNLHGMIAGILSFLDYLVDN